MSQTLDPIAQAASSNKQASGASAAKVPGLGANTSGLTVKGAAISSEQIKVANIILAVGAQLNAPTEALVAAIYAAMGESDMKEGITNGVFQTSGVPSAYNSGRDTAGQAHGFFAGGTSFGGPGAIARARQGQPAWEIANATEVNAVWLASHGDSYAHQFPGGQAAGIAEARRIVQAGGGGSLAGAGGLAVGSSAGGKSIQVAQPYYFQVQAHESYWDAMNRMAEEVGWRLITDGDRMYFDSDMELIRQKPAAVIDRDDPAVVSWSGTWDARHIMTQMTLTLICDEFEFRPGEVLQLRRFGPLSSDSSAEQVLSQSVRNPKSTPLPGRWLISEFTRTAGDISSTFTLVQPSRAKLEPAPEITTATIGALNSGSLGVGITSVSGVPANVMAVYKRAYEISGQNLPYTWGGGHGALGVPGPGFDCSGYTSAILGAGGMLSSPLVSGGFSGWGQAGRGKLMTVWYSSFHVFIEFTFPAPIGHVQANTSHSGQTPLVGNASGGPRVVPWGGPGQSDSQSFTPRHWPGT